jgi:hypothetical protein
VQRFKHKLAVKRFFVALCVVPGGITQPIGKLLQHLRRQRKMANKASRTYAPFKKFRMLDNPFSCCYCGEIGECFDHCSPASFHRVLSRFTESSIGEDIRGVLVLACNDCNSSLLGSNPEWLFSRRFKACKDNMYQKYKKSLNGIIWDEDEINDLDRSLRGKVYELNQKTLCIRSRYSYTPGLEFIEEVESYQLNLDNKCNQDPMKHWVKINNFER